MEDLEMKKIKVYRVMQSVYFDDDIEVALCTTEIYANKAIDRLVKENNEDRNSLYIEEDEIILNAIYGWDGGDLTERFEL